jgi:alpha-beta hydrolase superfamily lysophospholipase
MLMRLRPLLWAGLAAGLGACAPLRQGALSPPAPVAPHFSETAFVASDGARLGLSRWEPEGVEPWAVIVALHGMNDYAGAFRLAGPWWAERGVATLAFDLRGFGRSPGRGVWPRQALLLQDVQEAVAAARREHPGAVVALLGLSMGAAAAVSAQTEPGAPPVDRLILASPGVWGWSQLPWLYKVSLRLAAGVAPGARLEPPARVQRQVTATDNVAFLLAMGRDPNLLFETRLDALTGLETLMERAYRRLPQLPAHTQYLVGAKDEIIPALVAEKAINRLPPTVEVRRFPQGHHLLLSDLSAEAVWVDVLTFLADEQKR